MIENKIGKCYVRLLAMSQERESSKSKREGPRDKEKAFPEGVGNPNGAGQDPDSVDKADKKKPELNPLDSFVPAMMPPLVPWLGEFTSAVWDLPLDLVGSTLAPLVLAREGQSAASAGASEPKAVGKDAEEESADVVSPAATAAEENDSEHRIEEDVVGGDSDGDPEWRRQWDEEYAGYDNCWDACLGGAGGLGEDYRDSEGRVETEDAVNEARESFGMLDDYLDRDCLGVSCTEKDPERTDVEDHLEPENTTKERSDNNLPNTELSPSPTAGKATKRPTDRSTTRRPTTVVGPAAAGLQLFNKMKMPKVKQHPYAFATFITIIMVYIFGLALLPYACSHNPDQLYWPLFTLFATAITSVLLRTQLMIKVVPENATPLPAE